MECCKGYGRCVSNGCSGGMSVARCRGGNGGLPGVGGAVQALADRPRDEGPERFRDHRIAKLSSHEPSTIKGPGPTGRLVSSVTTNRTAGHSRCLSIRSDVRKARWRALLLYAPSLLGWAVACGPLIGPKDMVSHGRVSNLP